MLSRFTVRNVTINNAKTAVFSLWNWGLYRFFFSLTRSLKWVSGWTYQDVKINDCEVCNLIVNCTRFSLLRPRLTRLDTILRREA